MKLKERKIEYFNILLPDHSAWKIWEENPYFRLHINPYYYNFPSYLEYLVSKNKITVKQAIIIFNIVDKYMFSSENKEEYLLHFYLIKNLYQSC